MKSTSGPSSRTRTAAGQGRAAETLAARDLEIDRLRAQQQATARILQIISTSPGDAQPVFDMIVDNAVRLCDGKFSGVFTFDGELIHLAAYEGLTAEGAKAYRQSFPRVPGQDSAIGRAILSAGVAHIHDVKKDPEYGLSALAKFGNMRAIVAVPMMRDSKPVGGIVVWRPRPDPFPDEQIDLLKSFAAQASIAIENVRLFQELEGRNRETIEALEQQTATSNVLEVISRSPEDVQPVFQEIVDSAARLCHAEFAAVARLDEGMLHLVAVNNLSPEESAAVHSMFPRAPEPSYAMGRACVEARTAQIDDCLNDPGYDSRFLEVAQAVTGYRTFLGIPMLREGIPIGVIGCARREVRPFSDAQIELVKTFAAQGVIAVENVNLFQELGARNRDLTESLEQQTATSEILRVISSSPTDVQPVFDTIVRNALELSDALSSAVYRYDGELVHLVAHHNFTTDVLELERRVFPVRPNRETSVGRAILDRTVVHIEDAFEDREYRNEIALAGGWNSMVAVPMFRGDTPVGVIWVGRAQTGPFPDNHIEILRTFADQAVIAIENVRLFNELQTRNREITEALDQQTATTEVLKVISRSTFDLEPVLNTLVENATRLCGANHGHIFRLEDEVLRFAVTYGASPAMKEYFEKKPPVIGPGSASGLAVAERRTVHIHDVLDEPGYQFSELAKIEGWRTVLAVPMIRGDAVIGVIAIWKTKIEPFTQRQIELVTTFADQAVIAIENVRLFQALEERNKEVTEALEQQTATSEVLSVISSSPTDVQPVFDMISRSARRLCDGEYSAVFRYDGEYIHIVSHDGPFGPESLEAFRRMYPIKPNRGHAIGRAMLAGALVEIPDVEADPEYEASAITGPVAARSIVAVPMLRDGRAVGGINVLRAKAGSFPESQRGLLQTFAEQAVIAVENVRLFQELETRNKEITEALEQQTATSEVLGVISSSPTEIQPVFDTIARNAVALCDGFFCVVIRYEGELLHVAAHHNVSPDGLRTLNEFFPAPADRIHTSGRAILDRAVVHVPDLLLDPEYPRDLVEKGGWRSMLAVPMLREGEPIGTINVSRAEPIAFSDKQIELVKTFAAQAVIAIENKRLFQELQSRNVEITEALEQQTATNEVLRVISSSPTDVQPVFDTIAESAVRLCQGRYCAVLRFDGELVHFVSHSGLTADGIEAYGKTYPMAPSRASAASRSILTRELVHIPDVTIDDDYGILAASQQVGIRSIVAAPMLRHGEPIGTITVSRGEPGHFPPKQVELLETFAAQAVIAVENVRLFQELEARNAEITEALEQQTATTEVLQLISRSAFDLESVLGTLVENATRLCHAGWGIIYRYDGEVLRVAGYYGASAEFMDYWTKIELRPGRGTAASRAALERRTVHIPDALEDPEYQEFKGQEIGQWRSIVAVPMLKENAMIGVMALLRNRVSPFTESQIALITTFADQAAIAIENVRLFQELETRNTEITEALEQQTATSQILEVISSSPTDVQPVLDAVAENAARVCGGYDALIYRVDDGELHLAAHHGPLPWMSDTMPCDRGSVMGRAVVDRQTVHVHDLAAESEEEFPLGRALQQRFGHRTNLAVPLMREGVSIGVIGIRRMEVRPFSEKQIALLKTFADQAVIAIENVRLFQELDARTRELTRSVEELKALGEIGQTISSTLDLEKVLETIVARAVELSKADAGTIYEFDEVQELFEPRANYGMSKKLVESLRGSRQRLGDRHSGLGKALAARTAVQIPDLDDEPEYALPFIRRAGYRALLAVPLLREGRIVGGLVVRRKVAGEFSEAIVDLLETFATQSALAIQNARLFQQIQEKSHELEVASQHKSQFVANMSHELRTPLNAIIGYSEMLEEEAEDIGEESFLPDLRNIQTAGKHLLGLINEILDLSKIEAGKMELFLERFDVQKLVQDVVSTVQPLVEKNANALAVTCGDDVGRMNADLTKVRQALFNLLSNACKFTENGTISLEVVNESVNGQRWLRFSVNDSGIGMTQEQMGRLFQAFSQADASTTRQYGGTGLGLVISRRFCQMMGGDITVESEFGKGSTFTVRLPAEVVERKDLAVSGDEEPVPRMLTVPEGAPTVLVIDDDPAVRALMQRFLNKEGLSMLAAVDGREGLELAKAEHPDAITLDVLMPEMDGWSVLSALKADPELADIPVVMISIADETHGGYALGVAEYLTKPIDWKRLKAVLNLFKPADATCRVMIVEDDTRTRKMLRKRLEKEGWPVVEAENGKIALERLDEGVPDLMLLDLMMPEMDGFQLLDRMRADKRWRAIPVIVITAKDLTADDRRCLNGYVERVLEKGTYSPEALLHEVCDVVRSRVHPQASHTTEIS